MDPFLAEIRIFPFNFAPRSWAWCNGQVLPISQNTALFSLLGVTYGGDGRTNFALPNLQGRAPMHPGQGPGLSQYYLGQSGGSTTVTLTLPQIPMHSHTLGAQNAPFSQVATPAGNVYNHPASGNLFNAANPAVVPMAPNAIGPTGGNGAHNNMMPYLTCYFNIALQGVFPQRP